MPRRGQSNQEGAMARCRRRNLGWRAYMRKRSFLLVAAGLAIAASLVLGPAATAGTEKAQAGTVVIVHDQEPGILNFFLASGNGYTVSLVMNPILANGAIYNDK